MAAWVLDARVLAKTVELSRLGSLLHHALLIVAQLLLAERVDSWVSGVALAQLISLLLR